MNPVVLDDAQAAVQFLHYPATGTLVRGDPWNIEVTIRRTGQAIDTTGWEWRSQIRRDADADLLDEFTITTGLTPDDETVPCGVLLHLEADHTRRVPHGAVFDLEQLAPTHRTWWAATLTVTPDVSH